MEILTTIGLLLLLVLSLFVCFALLLGGGMGIKYENRERIREIRKKYGQPYDEG